MLEDLLHMPEHEFWPDSLTLADAVKNIRPLVGHKQITDAYLIGLARSHNARLATLDRAALALGGPSVVELIL